MMRTLEELKHYYSNATKDEIILDNYLDMVEHKKLEDKIGKIEEFYNKQMRSIERAEKQFKEKYDCEPQSLDFKQFKKIINDLEKIL